MLPFRVFISLISKDGLLDQWHFCVIILDNLGKMVKMRNAIDLINV